MFYEIQKVERVLIKNGIDYDFSFQFNSDVGFEKQVVRFAIEGQRYYFTEDECGDSVFTIPGSGVTVNPDLSDVLAVIENAVVERKDF